MRKYLSSSCGIATGVCCIVTLLVTKPNLPGLVPAGITFAVISIALGMFGVIRTKRGHVAS